MQNYHFFLLVLVFPLLAALGWLTYIACTAFILTFLLSNLDRISTGGPYKMPFTGWEVAMPRCSGEAGRVVRTGWNDSATGDGENGHNGGDNEDDNGNDNNGGNWTPASPRPAFRTLSVPLRSRARSYREIPRRQQPTNNRRSRSPRKESRPKNYRPRKDSETTEELDRHPDDRPYGHLDDLRDFDSEIEWEWLGPVKWRWIQLRSSREEGEKNSGEDKKNKNDDEGKANCKGGKDKNGKAKDESDDDEEGGAPL
ncbi:hypothetical protein GGR57DRAFT_509115 [Xylariaceae sp. FL1272]|nr:hypothetical protein GGR57DRAFT_509115 [Xylariaceae sp. FL1272]